jgi:hypothetical protein
VGAAVNDNVACIWPCAAADQPLLSGHWPARYRSFVTAQFAFNSGQPPAEILRTN